MDHTDRAAAGPWWCDRDDAGEAVAGDTVSFADMMADYSTCVRPAGDDLFQLVWEQGGGAAGPSGSATVQPAVAACVSSPPPPPKRFDPPSEDKMASWLCAIVKGEELELSENGRDAPAKGPSGPSSTTDTKEKLPVADAMGTKQEMRKPPAAGGSSRRSSHHGEAHSLTEKRRRDKINERLKTLQKLVPGCDKQTNQALTLDRTIQYMKVLQHQVQLMSVGPALPAAAPPVYPVPPPQYMPPGAPAPVAMAMPEAPIVLAAPPTMVPFGTMLQLPQYPVPMMMMPAAAAAAAAAASALYPAAAPPAAPPAGARSSAGRRQGSSSRKGKSSSRSLRQKH